MFLSVSQVALDKESAGDAGSISRSGRSPGGRNGNPMPVF